MTLGIPASFFTAPRATPFCETEPLLEQSRPQGDGIRLTALRNKNGYRDRLMMIFADHPDPLADQLNGRGVLIKSLLRKVIMTHLSCYVRSRWDAGALCAETERFSKIPSFREAKYKLYKALWARYSTRALNY